MIEVKLHDIGEGMTEAVVVHYLVKKGDRVQVDQPLVEVQTDKMVAEIPSPAAGVIQDIFVPEGQAISVGTTVLALETEETRQHVKSAHMNHPPVAVAPEKKTAPSTRTVKQRILASPYTRKIAREHGVDLAKIVGTGPAGRITDDDVHRFLQSQQEKEDVESKTKILTKMDASKEKKNAIPFRGRRKQIAKKMTHSLFTIPHCTHFEEVDVTELMKFREELKEHNISISATAFFIKALSLSLKRFPIFNAKLDEKHEVIHLECEHHIGIAVDTEEGLIVPVIKHVENKSLREIHDEVKRLTQKAQENRLTLEDVTGGTFTISNVGPLGGSIGATPIINHPEVALMAFHKTKKRPVVTEDDEIEIRLMMNISMSFDHRVADGAAAVAFTNCFAQFIENPKLMLMELV